MTQSFVLYSPIHPFNANQYFGEDRTCVDVATGTDFKTRRDNSSCPDGYVSFYKKVGMKGHDGIDIAAYDKQPVYAAHNGIIDELQTQVARGLGIGILTEERFTFPRTPYNSSAGDFYAKTRYWHLAGQNVKGGDRVTAGQLIGWADNTGNSSGNHLHFELKLCEKGSDGNLQVLFSDNGYFGSVDPVPYLSKNLSAFELNSLVTRLRYYIADKLNQSKLTG